MHIPPSCLSRYPTMSPTHSVFWSLLNRAKLSRLALLPLRALSLPMSQLAAVEARLPAALTASAATVAPAAPGAAIPHATLHPHAALHSPQLHGYRSPVPRTQLTSGRISLHVFPCFHAVCDQCRILKIRGVRYADLLLHLLPEPSHVPILFLLSAYTHALQHYAIKRISVSRDVARLSAVRKLITRSLRRIDRFKRGLEVAAQGVPRKGSQGRGRILDLKPSTRIFDEEEAHKGNFLGISGKACHSEV